MTAQLVVPSLVRQTFVAVAPRRDKMHPMAKFGGRERAFAAFAAAWFRFSACGRGLLRRVIKAHVSVFRWIVFFGRIVGKSRSNRNFVFHSLFWERIEMSGAGAVSIRFITFSL